MLGVKEDHAKNETLHRKFYGVSDVRDIISMRQLSRIRKIVRNYIEQIPSKLLTS